MKRLSMTMLALAVAGSAALGHAQDGAIDQATFDARLFAAAPGNTVGNTPGKKTYACFVRHYAADHLARHPKQEVSAMKLLVTAEIQPDEKVLSHSFRLGVNYRHRPGDFDSSGYCNHAAATDAGKEIRFDCGVDCEGGGINIALSKDDKSTIVRLERITVWQRNKPDAEAGDALLAGADDKIFRLDRTDARDCAALVTNRKELAAIRHK
jgi:predicted outer membrane protein